MTPEGIQPARRRFFILRHIKQDPTPYAETIDGTMKTTTPPVLTWDATLRCTAVMGQDGEMDGSMATRLEWQDGDEVDF